MAEISLCMIVRNEESVLDRCLSGVKDIADEIIIIDTGSDDETKNIAAKYTDKIYDFKWTDDFSAARNFSFSKAEKDYIMWLDADDVIDAENRRRLLELKEKLGTENMADMVMIKYYTAFDENGAPTFSYCRERLLRRAMNYKWVGAVHEVIVPRGNVVYSDIAVMHKKLKPADPDRNLRIFEKLEKNGVPLDARQKFYYARELYYHGRYAEAIDMFDRFFESGDKWYENCISACLDLSRCHMALGRRETALESLFKSFLYDSPRAEICCEIGTVKLSEEKYREAAFWYKTAAGTEPTEQNGGFSSPDCRGYIPYMQLCVCYDRLGEYRKAYEYNEMAGKLKPRDKNFLANKEYFSRLFDSKNDNSNSIN